METNSISTKENGDAKEETAENSLTPIDALQAVNSIVKRDDLGPEEIEQLRQLFREIPEMWKLYDVGSAIAKDAMKTICDSPKMTMLLEANFNGFKKELGYDHASPLEKRLIDFAALCWLRWQQTESVYTAALSDDSSENSSRVDYYEKRLSASQRRYLRALETLARVRRMNIPSLQVNIGGSQVNVAG